MGTKVKKISTYENEDGKHLVVRGKLILANCESHETSIMVNGKWIFPVIISETDQQDQLSEGDKVLYTNYEGRQEICTYLEDDEYGMGAKDSLEQRVTIRYSSTARILVMPDNFSNEYIQDIVDGKLKDEDEVFVECIDISPDMIPYYKIAYNTVKLFPIEKKEPSDWQTTDGSSLRESFGIPEESWEDIIQDIAEEHKILIDSRVEDYLEKKYNVPTKK